MIKQEQPPKQTVQSILAQLNIKSIDELLQYDHINPEFICKTVNLHKDAVTKLLFRLKKIINNPPDLVDEYSYFINLGQVVLEWTIDDEDSLQKQIKIKSLNEIQICSSQIVQIMGRSNCGKSIFLNYLIIEALKNNINVIYLDSNMNSLTLIQLIKNKFKEKNTQKTYLKRLKIFKFTSLAELCIHIHSIGELLIQKRSSIMSKNQQNTPKYLMAIDCLSRIELVDPQNIQHSNTMDFQVIQKLKRLFITFSLRICTIIYVNRSTSTFSLFQTFYKPERTRPKGKNNNMKLWDSIASRTICVDYTQTEEKQSVKKIHLSKDVNHEVFVFETKIKKK